MNIKISLTLVTLVVYFTGCTSTAINQNDFIDKNINTPIKFNENLVKEINTSSLSLSGENSVYYKNKIVLEDENEIILHPKIKKKLFNVEEYEQTVESILKTLSMQTKLDLIAKLRKDTKEKRFTINLKNKTLNEIITIFEEILDVDILIKDGTLFVYDEIVLNGVFENLAVLDEEISKNIYTRISNSIGAILQPNNVTIDETTGSFLISGTPNTIRRSKTLLENIINESASYTILKINVYQINNKKAQDLGIDINGIVNDIYNVGMGSTSNVATPAFSTSFTKNWGIKTSAKGVVTPKDQLNFGLKALEKAEILHSVSSPILTVFNGVKTKLENTRQIGEWTAGQLTEDSSINAEGAIVTTYTESEPKFETNDVGRVLIVEPKINMKAKHIQILVKYTETDAYAIESTTWQRRIDSVIDLKKNLISKHEIKGQIVIKDDSFSLLTGTKNKNSIFSNTGIPSTSDTPLSIIGSSGKSVELSDTLIIAQAILPKITKEAVISKELPFFFKK